MAELAKEKETSDMYRWYVLSVLVVVYVFNFIDRSILGILVEPIRLDLGVSDTLMGFLGGFAFAAFYTVMGIPIARMADTGVRRNIIAVCLALWSGATALCGFAQNFFQLLLARVGVAVGEAGGSPPSHSMISDMFPADRRATALGIYALGIPIGTMIGNLGGGWINEFFDWRTAFIVVGIPGLVLAVLVRFTVREPTRGAAEGLTEQVSDALPVGEVFKYLWAKKSFRYMSVAGAFHAFVGYGVGYWIPAMFNRSHGFTSGEIGTALFWLGFASIAGTLLGGWMGDKFGVRDKRWYMWIPGIATLVALPFSLFVYIWPDPYVALWVLSVPYVLGAYWLAPTFSMTQGLVGLRMRALAASLLLFVVNIIGMGLGPQFTGILSDVFAATTDLGPDSLRWALVVSLVFNLFSGILYWFAARTLREDLASTPDQG
ncbi:MAG: MFS transporter [Gammaproteobacteria bacterium]|nr:MFS transporter [Gammaproteobacteria bacterium]